MINSFKDKLKSLSSVWPKTVFVVVLILLSITIIGFSLRNKIEIVIDGQRVGITTYSKKLNDILENNGITVAEKDKISVALDSKVKDGDIIFIDKAVNVSINVDGKTLSVDSAEGTVKDLLEAEGIMLDEEDRVTPSVDEKLTLGMSIDITRVSRQLLNEVQTIAFETETRNNSDLKQGTEVIVQDGANGERTITTEVVYENGQEVGRRVVEETVSKEPVKKVVDIGTLAVIRPSRGDSGTEYGYNTMLVCTSTAYTSDRGDSGTITATGVSVNRDPNGYSTVAVDPRVIPLGTKLYIEGYGLAIAADTGGAIIGNKVDVYFNSYEESVNWGRRQVNVYILR